MLVHVTLNLPGKVSSTQPTNTHIITTCILSPVQCCRVTDLLLQIGGIHSGAGASSILWVGLAIGQQLSHVSGKSLAAILLAWLIMALLLITMAAAYPELRW